ncbi:type II toxin-antitoxin system HicA family toxin [Synechocystis salina LEGE 06155]|nr:type II toxin-antitoxin system HicA family toxin [Synechocystis salina LEGE 06155]
MRGNEFIKGLKRLAREQGIDVRIDKKRGKGSHVTLYYGDQLTIVRNPSDELKTGTLKAMLKQLGLNSYDIEGI